MAGLTLDTGALIGFERADRRLLIHLKNAELQGHQLTVSTSVIAEAWRGPEPHAGNRTTPHTLRYEPPRPMVSASSILRKCSLLGHVSGIRYARPEASRLWPRSVRLQPAP
jgi:hypothetical protein